MNIKQQQMLQKINEPMQNASMRNINPKISTLHIQNKYQATTNISPLHTQDNTKEQQTNQQHTTLATSISRISEPYSTTDATTNLKPYT
jgi:hypothetical protein